MSRLIQMEDYLALPKTKLVRSMEIFEKLEDCINNYENVAAFYGHDSMDAKETLYRGMRNAFLYGKWYAEELAKLEEEGK